MSTDRKTGELLLGRYRIRRPLGQGAHGRVYLADDLSRGGSRVALKLIETAAGATSANPAETLLRWFRHPSWAAVYDAGPLGEAARFQVTRFIPGASLDALSEPQPSSQVWKLLEDLARVLRALHGQGLIHYDVTPGNVIRCEERREMSFTLTDGGLAHVGPVRGVARGTPQYMAPELTEAGDHDHRVDLYSLGLLAYRMLTGRDPFMGGAGEVLKARREHAAPRASTHVPDISPALDDLVVSLLARNPNDRPFDASTLLERIREARGVEQPAFTEAEAVEAATGGPLVGRREILGRFEATTRRLSQQLPEPSKTGRKQPISGLDEPVLMIQGEPGSGATHIVETLLADAREEGLPAMLLAGRERAADRRGPLRRLADGLATLGRDPEQSVDRVRLDLRRGEGLQREERAHARGRAIEVFLKTVEDAAARTPFVIVVEDYGDLPELAKEAVQVLSRHLLSRAAHGGRQSQPAVALVIDLGSQAPDDLLIPDSDEPEKCVAKLVPLEADDLEAICQSRFGGLQILPVDRDQLECRTEGRPAVLAGLLSEAARRGDLKFEADAWHWNLAELADYPVRQGISPQHAEALATLASAERRILEQMAQVDSSVDAPVMDTLCERAGLIRVPNTALISVQDHGSTTTYAIANRGVRSALLEALSDEDRQDRARALLSALEVVVDPATSIDRASLRITLGDAESALTLLRDSRRCWEPDSRRRAQGLLLEGLIRQPLLARDGSSRASIAACISSGAAAVQVAEILARHLDCSIDDLRTARRVTEVLEVAERNELATKIAAQFACVPTVGSVDYVATCTTGSRAALRLRNLELAWTLVRSARAVMRLTTSMGSELIRERVRLAVVTAGLCILEGRAERAVWFCRAAESRAKALGLRLVRAQALNNLGPAYMGLGERELAIQCLRRSSRLKAAVGDIQGSAQTKVNLGRALEQAGHPLPAAAVLREAAAVAARHAFLTTSIRALRALGAIYDQQLNSRLAADTYRRGLTITRRQDQPLQVCLLSFDLAPLEAAHGHYAQACATLTASRGLVKLLDQSALKLNYLKARALVEIHSGRAQRASRLVALAPVATESALGVEWAAWTALFNWLSQRSTVASELPLTRSRGGAPEFLRLARWYARTVRADGFVPALPKQLEPAGLPGRPRPAGPVRRLVIETVLAAARRSSSPTRSRLTQKAVHATSSAGEEGLLARAVAVQSELEDDPQHAASLFSDAVARLAAAQDEDARPAPFVPQEFHQPVSRMGDAHVDSARPTLRDLHSLAHVRLRKFGNAARDDDRLASALRRVLQATAKMEAGGGLDNLLADVTQSTLDITQAERTCVVLIEQQDELTIRVATSASDQRAVISADDLSHTVINRVIMARKPLLLHDVFDDEELLGRPSITNLSLRSIICVPMIRGDVLYGVMYADNASVAGSFDTTDLEVLTLFAEQAAAALETNRLVVDLQSSMGELKAMQERLVRGERLRTIGEMSSGVAHEFNNLLTSILARVQLLNLNYLAPDLKKDLHLIEKACLDAAQVVRRLQSFSKQQRQGTFRIVDVSSVCRDAVEFLRPLWSTRRRRGRPPISVRLEAEAPQAVMGDPTELREVLTNLLKNALDVLDSGGHILVRAAREDGQVRVTVSDDGPGIPAELLPRVCDPFFTTKGERGTGLGLCLSQQIVERHGGTFLVESTEGHGTEILVTIPAADESFEHLPLIEHPSAREEGTGPRVLVIDDDGNVLSPLCEYLSRAGYDVRAAGSGEEGLEITPNYEPAIVISDISMPGIDGMEVCRRLKADFPDVPVVLMSGWATGVNPAEARRAGARALLAKPFAMQQVTELVATILKPVEPGHMN